jgi:SlyX protein
VKVEPEGEDPGRQLARLIEAEIKLAYLDDLLDVLNRTVFDQQQQIDQLTRALGALRQQVRATAPLAGTDPRDDIPPHY